MAEIPEISLDELAGLKAKMAAGAGRKVASSVGERRRAETAAQRGGDGRVRMAATDADGRVQLNGRVKPDVKNQVIELAQQTSTDMSSVMETALEMFFRNPDWAAIAANYAERRTRKRS